MYTKLFDEWNEVKKQLNVRDPTTYFKEGAVWYCSIGVNIGREIDGKHENYE